MQIKPSQCRNHFVNYINNKTGHLLLAMVTLLFMSWGVSQAQNLPEPTERVVLTLSGNITHTNVADTAEFDIPMLTALPQVKLETKTPWTDSIDTYEGPLLRDVLKQVGSQGEQLEAIALNDYAVDLPVEDAMNYPVLLAYKMNGQQLQVRDRGPLWIIYPWSDYSELGTSVYSARSIWQLRELIVD